jgi:hypothetical protein
MSLKTRVAAWENNGEQRRGLNRYAQERERISRELPGKPGSAMPEYKPYTHQEYVSGATQETVNADFRSGSWRIARRTGAAVLAGVVAYGLYNDVQKNGPNSDSMAPPAVVHEVGQSTSLPEAMGNQQELITSVSVVDLQG